MAQAKKKVTKSKVESVKEVCPVCESDEFAIGHDIRANRHCGKCHNVWAPLTIPEIKMNQYRAKYAQALDFAKEANSALSSLLTQIDILGDEVKLDELTEVLKHLTKESEIVCAAQLNMQ